MSDGLHPEFEKRRDELAADAGPIIGHQRAVLGADRFVRFVQGHGTLQAMALFLVISAMTVPQAGYSDEAIDALKQLRTCGSSRLPAFGSTSDTSLLVVVHLDHPAAGRSGCRSRRRRERLDAAHSGADALVLLGKSLGRAGAPTRPLRLAQRKAPARRER